MNKIALIFVAAAVLGIVIALVAGCGFRAKTPKTKSVDKPDDTLAIPLEGIGDTLIKFSFESYTLPKWSNSEVYRISRSESGSYVYICKKGNLFAKSMGYFDGEFIYPDFDKLIADLRLNSYGYTPFEDEDKLRDRWMIEIKYKDGHSISIVKYLDSEVQDSDNAVMEGVRKLFAKLLDEMKKRDIRCQSSRHTYDANGKLTQRIDYTADGIVHGGWDADNPLATF